MWGIKWGIPTITSLIVITAGKYLHGSYMSGYTLTELTQKSGYDLTQLTVQYPKSAKN